MSEQIKDTLHDRVGELFKEIEQATLEQQPQAAVENNIAGAESLLSPNLIKA